MPKNITTSYVLIAATGVLAGNSFAKQVIVQFSSPSTFRSLHQSFTEQSKAGSSYDIFGNAQAKRPYAFNTGAEVEATLENLNMAVVNVDSNSESAALQRVSGVSYVEDEIIYDAPMMQIEAAARPIRPRQDRGEFPWGITAIKSVEAWKLGKAAGAAAGNGARVLVLDTGVDPNHPDLANRFEKGKNFVVTRPSDEGSGLGTIVPDFFNPFQRRSQEADFFDRNGHGTHVAGTILGEYDGKGVVGVAPQSKLLMGRVCGKFGCSSVAIIQGVNWAIEQGVDVLSMSLGGPASSKAQADAMAAAARAGVIPVAASGNSGTPQVSYPAANPGVIAVGAINSKFAHADFSQWGPELAIAAPGVEVKSSVPVGTGRESETKIETQTGFVSVKSTSFVGSPEVTQPLVGKLQMAGLGREEDFAKFNRGNMALLQRGEIPFADKVKNAIEAGASAVVVYNNAPGLIQGALTQDGSTVAIPVVLIEQTTGQALVAELQAGVTRKASLATIRTDYASFQGTSMATPHVAGVVALMKALNKSLSSDQVKAILQNTATKVGTSEENAANKFGAGVVNAEAAVQAVVKNKLADAY